MSLPLSIAVNKSHQTKVSSLVTHSRATTAKWNQDCGNFLAVEWNAGILNEDAQIIQNTYLRFCWIKCILKLMDPQNLYSSQINLLSIQNHRMKNNGKWGQLLEEIFSCERLNSCSPVFCVKQSSEQFSTFQKPAFKPKKLIHFEEKLYH